MSHATVIVALKLDKHLSDYSSDEIYELVSHQMEPFNEAGEWFKNGSRWDWFVIGGRYTGKFLGQDIIYRKDLSDDNICEFKKKAAIDTWNKFQAEKNKDKFTREYIYGLSDNETKESLILKYQKRKISAYAFLINRHWHECERLGWFGTTAKTECEITMPEWNGICLHKQDELGARIISYGIDNETWGNLFFDKFIDKLEPDTVLVNVDFHV